MWASVCLSEGQVRAVRNRPTARPRWGSQCEDFEVADQREVSPIMVSSTLRSMLTE